MLTTNDFNGKVLVEYKRDEHRNPCGVLVSIGPGIIGWSLCSKHDTFTKRQALNIALSRASKMEKASRTEKTEYYENMPYSLQQLAIKMIERSYAYFKIPDDKS